jgi:hypothetical protein
LLHRFGARGQRHLAPAECRVDGLAERLAPAQSDKHRKFLGAHAPEVNGIVDSMNHQKKSGRL